MASLDLDRLPLASERERFTAALAVGPVVLAAPTGSGKSTLVPLWCAAQGLRTLVVEPRRVACRALHGFLARATDVAVAYTVRHEQQGPADAAVRYVTPGVALRRAADRGFAGLGCVVLDEFHERSMEGDLLLALLREATVRAVVMSATLDVDRLAKYLDATRVEAEGRSFGVTIAYAGGTDIPSPKDLASRTAAGVQRALQETDEGDVLVFLPGKGEIADAGRALASRVDAEVLELHAQLPRSEQDRVFAPHRGRRVILATNVAETSVTVPTVRAVVDSGLERRTTYRRARSVLSLSPISAQSATQRAGRAGRVAPGMALRLWSEKGLLRPDTPPEVLREDLDQLLLTAGGLHRPLDSLTFLDAPQPDAVAAARGRLSDLGLAGPDGLLTPLGGAAAKLPLDPLLARLVLEARAQPDRPLAEDVVDLVATLAHSAPLLRPPRPGRGEAASGPQDDPIATAPSDATARIRALRVGRPPAHGLRPYALAEARRIARQLREGEDLPRRCDRLEVDDDALAALVLRAYPPAAFVRRRKRYASPGLEVDLAADSYCDPEAEALVVLDLRSARGRGLRALHTATCALPVSCRWLAKQGLGAPEVGRVRQEGDDILGVVETRYAEVVLARREQRLTGPLAVAGATELIARGSVLKGAVDRLEPALALTAAWYAHRREPPPVDLTLRFWIQQRLTGLGLQDGGDLALLSVEDLLPDLISAEEQAAFEAAFPVRVNLPDRRCDVVYDFAARRVELVHVGGNTRNPPAPSALPPLWPGFGVTYRVHSRTWTIR